MATITSNGAIPDSITTLRDELIALATSISPGLTANLPASLIEDMASTGAGALAVQDQAYVDAINSIAPTTSNDNILVQLGNVYGIQQGVGSNTSVYVVFLDSTPGFVINTGFLVSDGTYQYATQEPTVIGSGGYSAPVFCLATQAGSWAVPGASSGHPLGTVTTVVTSVPSPITLNVSNPNPGTPGIPAQSIDDYRFQVIQAGRAVATGIPTLLRTALLKVSGVVSRLISIKQVSSESATGWEIIVGGGNQYDVANAIFQSMFNIQDLVGAQTTGTTTTVSLLDYPDTYTIKYVIPAQVTTHITVNWTTVAGTNYVSPVVVANVVQPAIYNYVNSVHVGVPISVVALQEAFLAATATLIDPTTLATLSFQVYAPGLLTPTGLLYVLDPESYFFMASQASVVVNNA